jgi:hypothetical protein
MPRLVISIAQANSNGNLGVFAGAGHSSLLACRVGKHKAIVWLFLDWATVIDVEPAIGGQKSLLRRLEVFIPVR